MNKSTRREFLQSTAGLLALSLPNWNSKMPKLAFSTLGCPKWTFNQIVDCATKNGYQGLEIRGILGELDLTKCPIFSPSQMGDALKLMEDKQLKFVDLGSSANMHFIDSVKRKNNLDEAKRFIDLAQKLNCPNIRVFPNDLPKDQKDEETVAAIIENLQELGDYAKGSSVNILLESHGKVIYSDMLHQIMQTVNKPNVGLVWDFYNMWSVTKEPPKEVYHKLKKYIRHIHVKDAKIIGGKEQYMLLGEGDAPVLEAINALRKGGFDGYYSFEWEKMWHPEIQEPEIAIPHFPKAFMKYWLL